MIDLTGKKFGRLTVVGKTPERFHKQIVWACRCDCGKQEVWVPGAQLRKGRTKSCGCLQAEVRVTANTKHGQASRRGMGLVYRAWIQMKQRCVNSNCTEYRRYGGRGIKVCERWASSYEAFAADMGPRPPGCSLERRENSGDYEPGNCYWATKKQQGRNKRNNRLITAGGETRCVSEWAEVTGINAGTIRSRLKLGWPPERAVGKS